MNEQEIQDAGAAFFKSSEDGGMAFPSSARSTADEEKEQELYDDDIVVERMVNGGQSENHQQQQQDHYSNDKEQSSSQQQSWKESLCMLCEEAFQELKQGQVLSSYKPDRVLDYFDAIVALATVFLFIKLGWEKTYNFKENSEPLLIAGLCFVHVMVYWINLHHFLKFSPPKFSVLQVWLLVLMSLGLVFYPMSLDAWIEGDNNVMYYIVNIYLCTLLTVFNFLLEIRGANAVYRLYHKLAPSMAVAWYSLAFVLDQVGVPADFMIWIAPFLYLVPLGAKEKKPTSASSSLQ